METLEAREGPAESYGTQYLERQSVGERRSNGRVYTPSHLVDFILDLVSYSVDSTIEGRTILDPACGAGVFLERAIARLARRLEVLGWDLRTARGHTEFVRLVSRRVFGVDLDPEACALARATLARAVLEVSPGALGESAFEKNIVEADFLVDHAVRDLPPLCESGFSFVVGNPPYVSATRLSAGYKRTLRDRLLTARGRIDLYTLFLERSLDSLAPAGQLAMITPDKFLLSQSAVDLRRFVLSRGAPKIIAVFRSHRVFEDAATVPCVTVVERAAAPGPIAVLECANATTGAPRVEVRERFSMPTIPRDGSPWQVVSEPLLNIARRLFHRHRPLLMHVTRISAGLATGRDEVFVLPTETASSLVEADLLFPAVRGRDISPYQIDDPGLSILLPYRFDSVGGPELVDLKNYPKALGYLAPHRAALERRHCFRVWNKAWHDVHDPVSLNVGLAPKILVPDVANTNRFAADAGQFIPLHSAYYLLPRCAGDLHYLTAILNSDVTEFLVRLLAPRVKDGFSRYRRQFLSTLPIPDAPPDVRRQVILAARRGNARTAASLVKPLFGLNRDERRIIKDFLERPAFR